MPSHRRGLTMHAIAALCMTAHAAPHQPRCPHTQGFLPSTDQLYCVNCDGTKGNDTNFGNGFYQTSSWTPAAVTSGTCACIAPNATSVMAITEDDGRYYSRCVTCPDGTTADGASGMCNPASNPVPSTPQSDLAYVVAALNSQQSAGINLQTATQVSAAPASWRCQG